MTEWTQISKNRAMTEVAPGVYVIVPESEKDTNRTPWICPICSLIMKEKTDSESFRQYQCCIDCANSWAEPDRNRWLSGWRPAAEKIEARVKIRSALTSNFKL